MSECINYQCPKHNETLDSGCNVFELHELGSCNVYWNEKDAKIRDLEAENKELMEKLERSED